MANGKTMQAVVSIAGTIHPSLQKSIATAQKSISKMGSAYKALGKITLGATVAGMVARGAVTAKCVDQAIDLQKQMSNVATLLDGDVSKRVGELQTDILKLSDTSSVATSDLTNGLYETISAFGDNEESVKRLEIAAKAAKAGNATTVESIGLLSAITKGYGDTSAEAMKKAADMSFLIVKLGQTNFPELAASMGRVVPLASAMKLKQEELSGAFATLTGVTGKAAEVSTQLRSILQGFMKPTKEMSEAVKQAGYKNAQAMLQTLGLQKSLLLLKKGCRGSTTAVAGLFSSVELGTAVMALVDAQAGAMAEKTKAMFESSGIAEKAYETQMNNFSSKWGKIINMASNFMTKIGVKILPILESMLDKAMPEVVALSEKMAVSLDTWAASIGKYIGKIDFGKVIKSLKDVYKFSVKNWKFISGVVGGTLIVLLGAVVVAIGWIPFAIAACVAAIAWLWNSWDDICKWCTNAWEAMCQWVNQGISDIVSWFQENMPGLVGTIQRIVEGIKMSLNFMYERFQFIFNSIVEVVKAIAPPIWEAIKLVFAWVVTYIQNQIKIIGATIEGLARAFNFVWDTIKSYFPLIGKALKNAFEKPIQNAIDLIKYLMSWIQGVLEKLNSMTDSVLTSHKKVFGKFKGWFGFGGDDSAALPAKAAGGFTSGLSLCGEAGTEAVISFDPRYRAENRGYLMTAADMLGMDLSAGSSSRQSVVSYHLGGVTFAPVIKAGAGTTSQDIVRQLKDALPDLLDMIQDGLAERSVGKYA